jgi:RNA:NAD 2'-phosphotransferase (TPT1/KptA family)
MAWYTRVTGILALMIHVLVHKNVASHVEKKKRRSKIKQISQRHVHCALSYVESVQSHQRYRTSQRVHAKCDSYASSRYFCLAPHSKHFVVCLV